MHTKVIGFKLIMKQMGYNDQWLGKKGQGIKHPIVVEPSPCHEGLVFGGKEEMG
jgi:hypothetical protein